MSKIPVLPPSGFRDFTPEETAVRQHLTEVIAGVYQAFGFQQISLSALENLSTLQGKGGGTDNEKLIFKVLKRGEDLERSLTEQKELADMGMRFDLTLPLARYYARFGAQLPRPFKVFQMGPVWRADRPQKGRFREFVQCDVDVLGSREVGAEVEVLGAILSVFEKLGIEGLELHLNDRRLLLAIGKTVGIEEDAWKSVLVTLDKLDKVGPEKVIEELTAKGIPAKAIKEIEKLLLSNHSDTPISEWSDVDAESATTLGQITSTLEGVHRHTKIVFNPVLVRGQDYYTGTIFEVRHPELSGSLAGGGRYNRLLEIFGGQETPAFGGSIGFERLAMLLKTSEAEKSRSVPHVFLPLFSEALRPEVTKIAQRLRAIGARVDIYPDAAKLKNQFKYANDRKIPFAAILGDAELASQTIKWKNMANSEEIGVSLQAPDFEIHVKRTLAL